MLVSGQSIYIGTSAITAVYQGNDLVWSGGTPTTGDSYYYYYQSEGGATIQEALAAFNSNKIQGPAASSTTQFSYLVEARYRGSTRISSVVCIAIPKHKELTRLVADGVIITPGYFSNKTDITINYIPFTLYYHQAVWTTQRQTGYTEPCFCYLASTATTISDAITDFSDNRKNGDFVSGSSALVIPKSKS